MDPVTLSLLTASAGTGAASILKKPKQYGFSKGDLEYQLAVRDNQISEFASQLAAARAKYNAQLPQFQQFTMGKFAPQLEAAYAAKGFQASGGAFASRLAEKAAELQAQGMLDQYNMEREDLRAVDSARGGARSAILGQGISAPDDSTGQALGSLSSALFSAGIGGMGNRGQGRPNPMAMGSLNLNQYRPKRTVTGSY